MTALPPRYRTIGAAYRERFGCTVYKVSVTTAQTCPNREGLRGMSVCTFCDEWGSAAHAEQTGRPLAEQVAEVGGRIRERYGAQKLLVYFQAYTTTFERVTRLERLLREALALPGVAGIVVGTRPDCLPPTMVRLLGTLARDAYVSVELGVQTLDDGQLAWLSRGHTRADAERAIAAVKAQPGLDLCTHLMFGLPGETDAQLAETALTLSGWGVDGVKLHNLHVLRGTPLAELHARGEFEPVDLPDYARKVARFLEHLAPRVAVHRLSAVASRWDELIAPGWARHKMGPTEFIRAELARLDTWQGRCYPYPPGAAAAEAGPAHSSLHR